MLDWALRYIRLGWPVIPLWPHDALGAKGELIGKVALGKLVPHGSKDATVDESQVLAWWAEYPDANIGLVTGHRFFAVDVDIKKDGNDTWDMLRSQHGGLPETMEAITGTGGRHILYALPDFPVLNSVAKLGPGLDIRGQGGYIVAAPSVHPETKRAYEWDGMAEIEQQAIAPAPTWLLRLIREGEHRKVSRRVDAGDLIPEGMRNDHLFRMGSHLRRIGFTAEAILAALAVVNRDRCKPPLSVDELQNIATSAARYAPNARAGLFGGRAAPAPDTQDPEPAITENDVERAAAEAIERNDIDAALNLAPSLAKLRPQARALITAKFRVRFKDFPTSEFKIASGGAKRREPPEPPPGSTPLPPESGPDIRFEPHTDSGNAERIRKMYGDDIRYCMQMQKWLVWDGRRWAVDEKSKVTQMAKRMCRRLYEQATGNSKLEEWARKSESQSGLANALKIASTEEGIPISADELDQGEYLLNCRNGIVDLRTGQLLPHDRDQLITKICDVEYNPHAECPRFLKFLHWAMGDNPDAEQTTRTVNLVSFLQRAFGYALTADVSEKAAFVFYGARGNNGKTTLLTCFRKLLGEYSAQISIDTLMTSRLQDAALRADLADLRAARFVITSEVEKEHRLSEGKLKYITAGMGDIKSCRKYENPIEFRATHKLFMDCNHRPEVRGTDDAIWSRLKPVPFDVRMAEDDPDMDKKLIDKLVAEAPGILAWAVRGCIAWRANGLGEPPEIGEANNSWREHDDPLKEFFEDCCEISPEQWVRSAELSAAYAWWSKRERERYPLGRIAFGERVAARGFKHLRSRKNADGKQMRTIEGVTVKDEIIRQMRADGGGFRNTVE
jgi:P4 family phage/plasmid primase-like protien